MKRKFIGLLIFAAAAMVFMVCSASAQTVLDDFNDISLVRVGTSDDSEWESYVIGSGLQSYPAKRYISPFYINQFETTYKLWHTVRMLSEKKGYIFGNPGQEGSDGRRGKEPTQINCYQPVTTINWYDAVVWCNALSELEGRTPCYTYNEEVLRDSTDTALLDMCQCNWNADGYRLPSEEEWEYAARKTKSGFQRGDLASGQVDAEGHDCENIPESDVAWFSMNSVGTHVVGTAGTPFTPSAPPAPGDGYSNGMNIFDMSGNVLEFCWDWDADYQEGKENTRYNGPSYGAERICRGGSWSQYTMFVSAADRFPYDPNEAYNFMGFRFCTTTK